MSLPPSATTYFERLAAGDFAGAADCFTADCFYSHPPYDPGADGPTGQRLEATSRRALRDLFALRGERDWHHKTRTTTVGESFFVEGVVRDSAGATVLSYLSSGRLGAGGLIERYVAYDSRPAVGRPL